MCPQVSHITSLGLGSLFSKTERLENKLTNGEDGLYNLSGSISKCVCQVILTGQERLYRQADSHLVAPTWSYWCPVCILTGQWPHSEVVNSVRITSSYRSIGVLGLLLPVTNHPIRFSWCTVYTPMSMKNAGKH